MNINTGVNPAQMKMAQKALKTLMKSDMGLALLSSLVLPLLAQQGQGVSLPSSPGFGNSGNAGSPSIGNFLGGSSGGGGHCRDQHFRCRGTNPHHQNTYHQGRHTQNRRRRRRADNKPVGTPHQNNQTKNEGCQDQQHTTRARKAIFSEKGIGESTQ